jgi:hypothetical protein
MSRKKTRPPNIYVAFPSAGRTKSAPGSPKLAQSAATSPPALEDTGLVRSTTLHAPSSSTANATLEAPPKTALRRSLSMSDRPLTSPVPGEKVGPTAERPKEPPRLLLGPSSWNVPVGFTAPDKKHIADEMMAVMENDGMPALHHKSSTWSQQGNFEKSAFRNAVILCNV